MSSIDSNSQARETLDAHVRDIIQWHFSPETGCPFWLDWAGKAGWNPAAAIHGFADLQRFPHFQDEWLRDLQPEVWVPKKFQGRPFNIFETGGTTGMPKQRIGWDDYKVDYEEFSAKLSDAHFPRGGAWLMAGPTGPRRLRLAIEHLANFRGSSCYFIDLDPRWVKKVLAEKQIRRRPAPTWTTSWTRRSLILKHRKVSGLFTTPKLLEAIGEKIDLWEAGIRGVFCGGTTMAPQYVRYIVEEVLENRIGFYPTYGNTLMGLAASVPLRPEDHFSVTYYAPQPRAVLRVVNPQDTSQVVALRTMGPRRTDHFDPRIFHAAFSGARRGHPPRTAPALCLGRRGGSAPLRRDGKEHCRRRLLK